jgi:hypothetical protein
MAYDMEDETRGAPERQPPTIFTQLPRRRWLQTRQRDPSSTNSQMIQAARTSAAPRAPLFYCSTGDKRAHASVAMRAAPASHVDKRAKIDCLLMLRADAAIAAHHYAF